MSKILSKEEREEIRKHNLTVISERPRTYHFSKSVIRLLAHADAMEAENDKLKAFVSDLTTPPSLLAVVNLHKLAHAAQELLASLSPAKLEEKPEEKQIAVLKELKHLRQMMIGTSPLQIPEGRAGAVVRRCEELSKYSTSVIMEIFGFPCEHKYNRSKCNPPSEDEVCTTDCHVYATSEPKEGADHADRLRVT